MTRQTTGRPAHPRTRIVLVAAATLAFAGGLAPGVSRADADGDLVPDAFDNCTLVANGPMQMSNQVDTDLDGYGNACDFDYSSPAPDFLTTTGDFTRFVDVFLGAYQDLETDHDGDTLTTTTDFQRYIRAWQGLIPSVGPGLACAGVIVPCLP